MKQRILYFFAALVMLPVIANAQVTTGAMNGLVTDAQGKPMPGVRVVATHEPSGTKYGAVSGSTGRYTVPALRTGGPYTVKFSSIGMKEEVFGDIIIKLGETYPLNVQMREGEVKLADIVVTSQKNKVMSNERTGAATNISKETIAAVPTLTRNIIDFSKVTPQANGRSFGGQDDRMNSLTIDGSTFNNTFGLSSTPAGQTGQSPISLDAIEEIQVNLAPYDVRQGGFVGAGISAITRSGDNEYRASVFYNFRNQGFTGNKADATTFDLSTNKFNVSQIGFRVGGPIIENKLFFFLNAEREERSSPATNFRAARTGETPGGLIARPTVGQLDTLRDFLKTKFGYDPGVYEAYDLKTFSNKATAKFDYNIDESHRASLRFQYLRSSSDILPSNSNAVSARRLVVDALNFAGATYVINNDIYSAILEVNSVLSPTVSNNLVFGYTANRDYRSSPSTPFPFVDILQGGTTLTSFGYELFTPFNKLDTDTWQIQDNLTYYLGDHTVTAGFSAEFFKFDNGFNQRYYGYYRFASLADFYNNVNQTPVNGKIPQPTQFSQTFSALPGGAVPIATTKASQFGVYIQDEFVASSTFKLTAGLRVDLPTFGNTAIVNNIVENATFKDQNGNSEKLSTGSLPSTNILWSPRIGFNWDVQGDRSMQVRGGTGIFSGRPPFVWLSNIITNNGVTAGDILQNNPTDKNFSPDVTKYIPANAQNSLPSTFTVNTAKSTFKFPQIWRNNIAVDKELPLGLIGTAEFIYSKNLESVYYRNANLAPATATFTSVGTGGDNRARFPASFKTGAAQDSARRINFPIVANYVLDNTDLGYSYSVTAQVQKPWGDGWMAMIAYNYATSRDITSAGSIAANSWLGNQIVNNPNDAPLSFSDSDNPHRIIASASYRYDFSEMLGLTISMFYEARTQGRFSYTINGDMNADGSFGNDLMFVPKDASQIRFEQFTAGGKTWTVADQWTELDRYISQDEYLNSRRGQYAERNGALRGWVATLDATVALDVSFMAAGKKNTIQFRVDALNLGNMLNSSWGVGQIFVSNQILAFRSVNTAGEPVYRIREVSAGRGLPQSTFIPSANYPGDVWQLQFGIRYTFN